MAYGAVYEAYLCLWSCKRDFPWFIELHIRLTMVYGAVYEAYPGL